MKAKEILFIIVFLYLKRTLLIIAILILIGYAIFKTKKEPQPVEVKKTILTEIEKQQCIIDAYFDSCNFCHESKLKYYGDMLEIETIKMEELKKNIK